ncbi:MAG: HDOD domain-containing protein [Rhodoferax sp.]
MIPIEPRHPTPIAEFLREVQWPVMPEVGQALIRSLSDEDTDTMVICRIIRKDPALTATLLRMANSALFGLSGQIDTLERAVHVVGLALIRARAVSICMARGVSLPAGMDRTAFWRYSMLCAGYAQWLADLCDVDDQEAWLAGMMLRLGEVTLGQVQPLAMARIAAAAPGLCGERWLRERQAVGFDEGQITAELAQHWDFPPALVHGLRYAAFPLESPKFFKLAAVLHVAGWLADLERVTPDTVAQLPLLVLKLLALSPEQLLDDPPDPDQLADITMFQG